MTAGVAEFLERLSDFVHGGMTSIRQSACATPLRSAAWGDLVALRELDGRRVF
jgi:hypothetical protein